MKSLFYFSILLMCLFSFAGCKGQKSYGQKYLQLSGTISMPGVKGRIDHFDVNLKDQLIYVAALGNNTLEVADITNGRRLWWQTGETGIVIFLILTPGQKPLPSI
jgi:hypothetical protein